LQLNLKTFSAFLSDAATAVQSAATPLLNLTPGSVLRAILEANSAIGLWMQSVFFNILLSTRLATSGGTDCDTFGADFGFYRLPATTASGLVTFARFTATNAATIPLGTEVTTVDNQTTFAVIQDTTNSFWSPTANAYVIPANTSSANIPVQCLTAGSIGNVGVGMVGLLGSGLSGVDTVTNAAAFTNGSNAESDAAFRLRFVSYIQSLSRATLQAVGYAISSLEQGISYTIQENVDAAGNWLPGHMTITVDDGSHNPSATLMSQVASQIELYRGATISYSLFPPTVVPANVVFTLTPAPGYTWTQLVTPVTNAVSSYLNAMAVGQDLYFSRLPQVIYDSVAGVQNVSQLTLNGASADLVTTPGQVITAGSVVIN
jgi:uncharacterized phage protein gp47/JayE